MQTGKKEVCKGLGRLKKAGNRILSFVMAVTVMATSITLPQASTQLSESIPFEYGQGAITNLSNGTLNGQSNGFKFDGKNAYPIANTEKTDRYIQYSNAGYYIGEDGMNHAVDMRVYIWRYQEDEHGDIDANNQVYPFVFESDGVFNISSNKRTGTYEGTYGEMYNGMNSASNGGVFTEYHFYEAGTDNEISFKGVMTFNDIDGITKADNAVNEGVAMVGGSTEVVLTTSSTINQVSRAGYDWYQGSMQTDALPEDGLDQDDQKVTVKFTSTPDNPLKVVHRLNTVQSDGRIDGYLHTMQNETVTINYVIPDGNLPVHSSNKKATELIRGGGGEPVRYLDYGTKTNSDDAQKVLNAMAEEIEGYTFDGWYTSDQFTEGSKWNGTDAIVDRLTLYGRYVANEHNLIINYVNEANPKEVLSEQTVKPFKYGDTVSSEPKSITHKDYNKTWMVVGMECDGGERVEPSTSNVHYDKNNRVDRDVEVTYFYREVDGTGKVVVHHVIEGDLSTKPDTWKPLDGGKHDAEYTGLLGEERHVSAISLDGWKVTKIKVGDSDWTNTISTGVTPKYTVPETVVYIAYEPDLDSKGLTIKYVYEGEPEVHLTTASDQVTGQVGQKVNADEKRITKESNDLDGAFAGLEFLGVKVYGNDGTYKIVAPGEAGYNAATQISLQNNGQVVTFVYRIRSTDIIVRHVSVDTCDGGDGNRKWEKILLQEDTKNPKVGSVFTAEPESFEGYELVGDSGNTVYTVKDSDYGKTIYIDYYYKHTENKVTVHHRDEDGNVFVFKEILNGSITETPYTDDITYYHFGQEWIAKIKPHYGYDVIPTEEVSGTMGSADEEVTYVYAPKTARVIAHYQTRNGQEIVPPVVYDDWRYADTYTVYADTNRLTDAQRTELNTDWRLISDDRLSGLVNSFYDAEAGSGQIDVYFYYTNADATVVVKHIWKNELGMEEDLFGPEIFEGEIGKTEWESHPWADADKNGFVCVQEPTVKSGTMDQPSLTVEYVYEKKTADITIEYKVRNEDGTLSNFGLAPSSSEAKFGDAVSFEPKIYPDYVQALGYESVDATAVNGADNSSLRGWNVNKDDGTVQSISGTVDCSKIVITFIYEPKDVKVTTRYKDSANGDIKGPDAEKAADWVQTYKANETYTTHNEDNPPPEFYGYEWSKSYPWNAYGQLGADDVFVTYLYNLKPSGYVVRYVDTEGNRLTSDKVCSFDTGNQLHVFDDYSEQPIAINGYQYKGLADGSAPEKGTLEELNEDGSSKTVIIFEYDRSAASVVVRYVDTENNKLEEPDTLNGSYGNPFTTSPKDIYGWTLISVEATGKVEVNNDTYTVSGHYDTYTQTIKYIYTKTDTKVVVNHIDEETKNSLAEPVILEGKVGDSYSAKPVDLYGYSYIGPAEVSAPVEGTMPEGVTIVNLMYRRNDATVTVYFVDNVTGEKIVADKNGQKVTNPVIINGRYKDLYATNSADIYGWELVRIPDNASGAMIDGNIDVEYRYAEIIPTVTARYIDADDGHEVSETETITGATGTRYETIAKDYDADPERYPELYGYRLTGIPENAAGKFGEEDITVTYLYEKKTRTITVRYVEYRDGEMVDIAPADTVADLTVGEHYDTYAKTIYGYELIEVPDNAKGYVTEKPITVIYVYQAADATVRVRYVNESLEDIAPSTTIAGKIGDDYTTTAKVIPGYQLVQTPANYKGKMEEKETNVMYVYKVASTTVTVKYINLDEEDPEKAVLDVVVKNMPFGSDYTTEKKEFNGLSYVGDSGNTSGRADNVNGTTVFYYYSEEDAFVTARYLEKDTNKVLSAPVMQSGKPGTSYVTAQKDITGYQFDYVDGETRGTLEAGNNIVVTYYYTAIPAKVIAQYVDTNMAVIASEEVITGVVGDAYNTEQKSIEGYTFHHVNGVPSGTMTERDIVVVYVYEAKDVQVVSHYVDTEGNTISDSVYQTYKRNARYGTEAKEIYGYTLTETPANAFGNADKDVINVTYVYRKLSAVVNVVYIDDETEEAVASGEVINGSVGDSYETQAKEVIGYVLVKTPVNASGKMTVEPITVTYRYAKEAVKEDAKVTVKYVDADGKELLPSETIEGKVGDEYSTTAKAIPGYTLSEEPKNASGTMTKDEIIVTYVYEEVKPDEKVDAKVIVRYVDEKGQVVAEGNTIEGKVGDIYETKAKEINGYKLIETPRNASGTMTKEDTIVTYVYSKIQPEQPEPEEAKVIVKFVDSDGKELSSSVTIKGEVGDEYTTEAKKIEGYELDKAPGNAKGTMTKEDITVVYVYKEVKAPEAEKSKVTVKYVDKDGKEIAPSTVIDGKVGDKYEAKPKDLEGFKLVETPSNAKGTITKDEITVIFVYEAKPAEEKKVNITVKYVDESGKTISNATIVTGKEGDSYEIKPKDITGYELVKTPENAKGKFADGITVTFVYKAKAKADAKVIVRYTEEVNGREISARTTINGKVGDNYTTNAKTINGYKLVTTPSNAKGIMTEKDTVVTYIYRADKTTADKAEISVKKESDNSTVYVGSDIKYTVTVAVTGADAKNVEITDKFEDVTTSQSSASSTTTYIVDKSTRTFHSTSCTHLDEIAASNKARTPSSYAVLVRGGYTPASDCNPSETVKTTSRTYTPDMTINRNSISIKDEKGNKITPSNISYGNDGSMTITVGEIKKGSTYTITYTASTNDTSLANKRIINAVVVKADGADSKKASASVTMGTKSNIKNTTGTTGTTGTNTNKNQLKTSNTNGTTTNKNTTTTSGNNAQPSNWVKTGDSYLAIIITLSGVVVAGGLAIFFLKKKKH